MITSIVNSKASNTLNPLLFCSLSLSAIFLGSCSSDTDKLNTANPYTTGSIVTSITFTDFFGGTPDIDVINIAYDNTNQTFTLTDPDSELVSVYALDANGLVISQTALATDDSATTTYQYDDQNRLISVERETIQTMTFTYPTETPDFISPINPILYPLSVRDFNANGIDFAELVANYDDGSTVTGTVQFDPEESGTQFSLEMLSGNTMGLVISSATSDFVVARMEYDYDDDGNLLETREFDNEGVLEAMTVYTYAVAPSQLTNLVNLFSGPFSDPLRFNFSETTQPDVDTL
jgi:YD repeat-containing protein